MPPKSVHRPSFQASLRSIPEFNNNDSSPQGGHELQDLSGETIQKPVAALQKGKEPTHSFNPTDQDHGQNVDRVDVRLPGGKRVAKKEIRWWERNIARVVPVEDDVRDHFALERTFLAYIRTSNALASLAVAIYQLSRMSSPAKSTQPSTPRVLNLEKASTLFMMVGALVITVVGCSRFLVGQKRVEHGKCRTGGIDLGGVGGWMFVVSFND